MNAVLNNPSAIGLLCLTFMSVVVFEVDSTNQVRGTQSDFGAIDTYIKDQMKQLGIPGMALGIVHEDQIIHLQGFGEADSTGQLVTPQTPFQIGSLTKSFTALAVMQLVEAGKTALDAPVQKYIPWFTLADQDAAAKITVRNLLNQSSGLSTKDGNRFWNSDLNMEEAVRELQTVHLGYPVGTKYQYCNMNYVILGVLIEKVSGQSYADFVNEHILIPLGMHNSYTSHDNAVANGLAEGHYYVLGHAFSRDGIYPPAYLATGLLSASAEDLAHYAIAQLNHGNFHGRTILSTAGMTELHVPAIPMGAGSYYYAMGWAVGTTNGMPITKHSGDIISYHSIVMLQPGSKWGVILLANASGFEQIMQVDHIAQGVMDLLNQKQPIPVSLPFMFHFLYWGVLLTPLMQIIGIVRGLLHFQAGVISQPWQVTLTVVVNLTIAFLFLFKIPGLIPFPLSSLRVFYPELGYGLIGSAVLGFGWSIAYPILRWIEFIRS